MPRTTRSLEEWRRAYWSQEDTSGLEDNPLFPAQMGDYNGWRWTESDQAWRNGNYRVYAAAEGVWEVAWAPGAAWLGEPVTYELADRPTAYPMSKWLDLADQKISEMSRT